MTNNCIFSLEWRRRDNVRIASRRINATLRGFQRHRSGHKETVKYDDYFRNESWNPVAAPIKNFWLWRSCFNYTHGNHNAINFQQFFSPDILIYSLPCFFHLYIFPSLRTIFPKLHFDRHLTDSRDLIANNRQFPCQDRVKTMKMDDRLLRLGRSQST